MYNCYGALKQVLGAIGLLIDALDLTEITQENFEGSSLVELINACGLEVIKESGLLCAIDSSRKTTFGLVATAIQREDLHIVQISGERRMIDILKNYSTRNGQVQILKKVATTQSKEGHFVTKENNFQNNGIWIISTRNGKLEMWQISIVTDVKGGYSFYYLSVQLVYQAQMYNDKGALCVFPDEFQGYTSWPALSLFLKSKVDVSLLPPAETHKPKVNLQVELQANQCQIIFFNQSKRYGLGKVASQNSAVMIHASAIEQEFPALANGQIVTFKSLLKTPQGYQLVGVTE